MIKPTDADIVEAMRLVHAEDCTWIDMNFGDASTGTVAHARTLAKLRVAMEGLGKVARDRGGFMGEYHADCQQVAREALTQIGDGQ